MPIGPVQLIVLGFDHPEFHGEITAELQRLHDEKTVRVIDALAVHKDAACGWHPTVITAPVEAHRCQVLAEEIAAELRATYDLKPIP